MQDISRTAHFFLSPMASRALALSYACAVLHSLAAPVDGSSDPSSGVVFVTDMVTSSVNVLATVTSIVTVVPTSTLPSVVEATFSSVSSSIVTATTSSMPSSPAPTPSALLMPVLVSPELDPAPTAPATLLPSFSAEPVTTTDTLTDTIVATYTAPPTTVTVLAAPTTITQIVTIYPSPTLDATSTAWVAPTQMSDLSAFNVTHFAYGKKNMRIVASSPPNVTDDGSGGNSGGGSGDSDGNDNDDDDDDDDDDDGDSTNSDFATDADPNTPLPTWNSSSAALEMFYPANSINPAQDPQGGAEFYAAPLDLTGAQNVSLAYSVFFPEDFDWVQAGKLPGLYGGHEGCSGGNSAKTCFSTRLMWRENGAGELYLYAPKDKQTDALCATPPHSVCDAAYGLSIGRGAFNWTAGAWTHVRQTVTLNTPGLQDGAFVLEVNGSPVINAGDVFYRDVASTPAASPDSGDDGGGHSGNDGSDGGPDSSGPGGDGTPSTNHDGGSGSGSICNGILGQLLGPLLGCKLVVPDSPEPSAAAASGAATMSQTTVTAAGGRIVVVEDFITTSTVTPSTVTNTVYPTTTATSLTSWSPSPTDLVGGRQLSLPHPVELSGLFFSTFFGGHEPSYATPKDQYAWFKEFSMSING